MLSSEYVNVPGVLQDCYGQFYLFIAGIIIYRMAACATADVIGIDRYISYFKKWEIFIAELNK